MEDATENALRSSDTILISWNAFLSVKVVINTITTQRIVLMIAEMGSSIQIAQTFVYKSAQSTKHGIILPLNALIDVIHSHTGMYHSRNADVIALMVNT